MENIDQFERDWVSLNSPPQYKDRVLWTGRKRERARESIPCHYFFTNNYLFLFLSPLSLPPSSFQELRGIKLRLRWFNVNNFVKFFCVSVDHLQFQKRTNKEMERKETKKTKKKRRRSSVVLRRGKVRLKQRVLYKTVRWLAKVITSCFPCQRRMINACRFLIIYLILVGLSYKF